jgi:DNA modification methylase
MKPTIQIEMISVEDLIPYARNSRTHSDEQIAQIAASIREFGFTNPVLIGADNDIIAGHGRILAARKLGIEEAPCIRLGHLTPEQKRAYVLADNKLALNAGWDEALLRAELEALREDGFELDLIGFSKDELADIFDEGSKPDADPDSVKVEPPKISIAQPGEIYELIGPTGRRHRLLCGDSTRPEDVDRLMNGSRAHLVHTDPPYGVSYESDTLGGIQNDEKRDDDLVATLLLPALREAARVARDDAGFYIWHASTTRRDFEFAMQAAGLQERQYIIWVKPSFVLGRSDYHWQHEPCYYAGKAGQRPKFLGDRKQATVWRVMNAGAGGTVAVANGIRITNGIGAEVYIRSSAPKGKNVRLLRLHSGEALSLTTTSGSDAWEIELDPKSDYIHPTQKPIEIAQRAIRNHCETGDLVLDLFAGSGSTIVAAETLACLGYGMEKDPRFVDAIAGRWLRTFHSGKVVVDGKDKTKTYAPKA